MTTAPALQDSAMPLGDFLDRFKVGITEAVARSYPPLVTRAEPTPGLLRQPLGRQAEAITAVARSLHEHRNTLLVGEMGTGKSYCSIASASKAGMNRTLVLCPPHLVKKWAREVHEAIPGARTRILESISQVEALAPLRYRTRPALRHLVTRTGQALARLASGLRAQEGAPQRRRGALGDVHPADLPGLRRGARDPRGPLNA